MRSVRHSLLIPCYRAVPFLHQLAEQVDSLNPEFDEVLLVDDGSDDETFELATSLGLPISKLEKNMGPGAARNRLAEMAIGEWIHFLDADDLIAPDFLQHTLPEATSEIDVILCSGEFIDPESEQAVRQWSFDVDSFSENPTEAAFVTPVPTFCSLIRRSTFLQVGGFDEKKRCWEDGDLHLRLAAADAKFCVVPRVLSTSPRHEGGLSSDHLYCHRCRLEFVESYLERDVPISQEAFARELSQLGELFLGERKWKLASRAFFLAEQCGIARSSSKNPAFQWILSHLRPRNSQMLSAAARATARTLTHS